MQEIFAFGGKIEDISTHYRSFCVPIFIGNIRALHPLWYSSLPAEEMTTRGVDRLYQVTVVSDQTHPTDVCHFENGFSISKLHLNVTFCFG